MSFAILLIPLRQEIFHFVSSGLFMFTHGSKLLSQVPLAPVAYVLQDLKKCRPPNFQMLQNGFISLWEGTFAPPPPARASTECKEVAKGD